MARFQIEGGIYMHANTFTICQRYFFRLYSSRYTLESKSQFRKKKKKNQVYNIKDNSTAEIVACVLRTACMW